MYTCIRQPKKIFYCVTILVFWVVSLFKLDLYGLFSVPLPYYPKDRYGHEKIISSLGKACTISDD